MILSIVNLSARIEKSICLLMGSCSGGTSSRVADSGTSAYPSSTSGHTPTNTSSTNPYDQALQDTQGLVTKPITTTFGCGFNVQSCYYPAQ